MKDATNWEQIEAMLNREQSLLNAPPSEFWDGVDEHRPHRDFDGNPISFRQWAIIMETQKRIVAQDHVGDYFISTVWIGLDHGFGHDCPPLIYETMIFKGHESDVDCRRYSTWAEAQDGHAALLEELRLIEDATS